MSPRIPQQTSAFFASRLRTPQIIRLDGDATGSVQFDGTSPVDLPVTAVPGSTAYWVQASFVTSAALAIGLVNLWSDGGAFHVRQADQSLGREASGFVLSSYLLGDTATVYFNGILSGLSGLAPGKLFLANGGLVSATAGTVLGQEVGWAKSATELIFMPKSGVLM